MSTQLVFPGYIKNVICSVVQFLYHHMSDHYIEIKKSHSCDFFHPYHKSVISSHVMPLAAEYDKIGVPIP